MSSWSPLSWVLAHLQPGWRTVVVRQLTMDSSASVVPQDIRDGPLDRVSVVSVSRVPVGEEAAILKQVHYLEKQSLMPK